MSLLDKLMAIDKGEFAKEKTEDIPAAGLSEIMGEKVMIKIKAINGDRYSEITTRGVGKKGDFDYSKAYDINAHLVVEGVIEPNLKNEELQKHFGCATPKDLAKLLFKGGELTNIANRITDISGFSQDIQEEEDAVKN